MNAFSIQTRSRQHGLTLIELMIALLIGLMLTGGALQVFISSKDSFRTTESNSQLMQNGRIALDFINRAVSMAGFYSDFQKYDSQFPADTIFSENQVIEGTDDSITIRYYGYADNLIADCQGAPVADDAYTTITFYLEESDEEEDVYNLMCKVEGKSPDVVVAENVEQLQFRYGLAATNQNNVTRYVTAGTVGANWQNVRSVRTGILFRSGIRAASTVNTRSYNLFGTSYTSSDNYLRETFVATTGLWNVIQ